MPALINSDDGVVSGSSGLKTTGANDGILALQNNGTTNVTVTAAGLVGIGSASPVDRLQVSRAGADVARFTNTQSNGGDWQFKIGGGGFEDRRLMITDKFSGADNVRVGIDSNGNFQFNSGYGSAAVAYGCRAWVNFNGTGTVAIRGSGNVTSITDNATGDYTVNFTTAMPDANYAVCGINSGSSSNADWAILDAGSGGTNPTSSTVRVRATANGNVVDTVYCNVAIFR